MGKKNKQKRTYIENKHDESEHLNENHELSQYKDQPIDPPGDKPERELPRRGKKNKQKRKDQENKHDESEHLNEDQELSQNEDQLIDPRADNPEQELPRMGKKNKEKRKDKGNKHDESEHLNEDQELNQNENQLIDPPGDEPEQELPRRGKKNKQKRKDQENKHDESEHLNEDQELSQNEDQLIDPPADEPEQELPRKRDHDEEDDSDAEDKPKRKKKKKPIVPAESTGPKKGAKSIRQMKREKFAARQAAAQVVVKDQHKSECLNYLSQWKHNRQNWKFMKAKQVWLFKNKFSTILIPDASWPTLLEYFDSAQGNIRNMLLADANKIIKQLDDWTELQNEENKDDEDAEGTEGGITKPDGNVYKRARDLIQCLGE